MERRAELLLVFGLGLAAMAVALFGWLSHPLGAHNPFSGYWASGQAANRGGNPFAVLPQTTSSRYPNHGALVPVPDVNLNPPCLLPLFQLLALGSQQSFGIGMTTASFLALALTGVLLLRRGPPTGYLTIVWLLLSAPVVETFRAGQVYFLLLLLGMAAFVAGERRAWAAAGVALGLLAACKPVFAPAILVLFCARHYRVALYAAGSATMMALWPVAVYGPRIYLQWLHALSGDMHWLGIHDVSIPALFHRLGWPHTGEFLAAAILLAACAWAWKTRPDFQPAIVVGLAVSLLASPLAWIHYILALAPWLLTAPRSRVLTSALVLALVPTALWNPASAAGSSIVAMVLCALFYLAPALVLVWHCAANASAAVRSNYCRIPEILDA
jgi:alpha-1,2-mannosyltransferase